MKRLGQYIFLLIIIGVSAYSVYYFSLGPCDKPLEYSIGRFDTQFGVSKESFKSYLAESETVWEKALGWDIFLYDPDANFKINLIYDERQLSTTQKQKTEFGLSAIEEIFKKLDTEFNIFKNQYDQKVSVYEQALILFKKRKSVYDEEVSFWNNKKGAPEDKYQILETERKYLNIEAERLNNQTIGINNMTQQLNALLKERNAKAAEYNRVAENYNKKYGGGLEFNQAEYINDSEGKRVNIYQFGGKKDLVLALTHEFGHAIGMNHIDNPKSIMYYITGINAQNAPIPSAEDLAELNRVCK
mgnify:CR=1 FL=1